VVLVTATDGAAGLAAAAMTSAGDLGRRRLGELEAAAEALGAARVVHLGYPDGQFGDCGIEEPARALARLLDQEGADLFTGYDPSGGYGHPDHVHVHRVARAAAELADGIPLLEATVDRAVLVRVARIMAAVPGAPPVDLDTLRTGYLPRVELTHQVDVRPFVAAKIAGLAAHASQGTGSRGVRTVTLLRRLPDPLARLVLGREWFREVGAPPGLRDDIFGSCR
jgi:LmbE family N-acetylglucosaminyl deacetylase